MARKRPPEAGNAMDHLRERMRDYDRAILPQAHADVFGRCLHEIGKVGFKPSKKATASLKKSKSFSGLADEAAAWAAKQREELDPKIEIAVDVICAVALFYESFPIGHLAGDSLEHALSKFAGAAQLIGIQETMFGFAELGYLDELAYARAREECWRLFGKKVGEERHRNTEDWNARARRDWEAYSGPLPPTAWARRHCPKFGRQWRAVYEAIKGVKRAAEGSQKSSQK